jgi:hypothetical protein
MIRSGPDQSFSCDSLNYPLERPSVQQKETINYGDFADITRIPPLGRLVAIDPGTKRVGLAVCDPDRFVCRPLPVIERSSWKKLLSEIRAVLNEFDAKALVIGLPLESNGDESEMSLEARKMAQSFSFLSISLYFCRTSA